MASTPSPWQKPSRFKEHLSISPSDNYGVEQSRFSPDSPPAHPLRSASLTLAGTPPSLKNARDIPEDVESLRSHGSHTRRLTVRDRFTKIFFDVRTLDDRSSGRDGDLVSVRPLSPWAPLNLDKEKSPLPTTYPALRYPPPQKKQKKRFRWWALLLILVLLALLGNVAFLNVRVVELTKVIKENTPSSPTPSNPSSSGDVQECLSQFTLNAPSDPSAYPCSTCLPVLSNVTGNADAANALQFCGLRAILESTSTTGQTALSNGGWGKDLRVCTWSGVSCSDTGLVTSLTLTFPAVPALIPTEIAVFSQLQSLQVTGDGNSPAGALPDSFRNLTSLTALHLESTAITTIPNDLFSLLTKVTELTLIANGKFAGDLTSITSLPLQRLIINKQRLANPIDSLARSQSLQRSLLSLDLSSNSLPGSIPPSISSLAALTQLHLDNNNLEQAVPASFPRSLQSLTISNNTNLSGTMPSDVCSSIFLKECNLRGTNVNETSGCGICQF
jgi:hypothetical protein